MIESQDTGQPSLGSTSTRFLRGLQAREPAAWRRLVRLYGPLVYGWCRRAGLSPQDADDLVQEVYQAVTVSGEGYRHDRPGDTFRGWLRTITRHRILNFFRDHGGEVRAQGGTDAQQQLVQLPAELLDDSDQSQSDSDRQREDKQLAHRALALLSAEFEESTRRAFERIVFDGRSPAEVAAELEMSVAAVYQAKSRVLKRLREELAT
jgi:RNA polymerase sigma-70 factor (ECF subfamily)